MFKSRGVKGPECKNDEDKSTNCQMKGIRDRNFNMSVNDGIKYLWEGRCLGAQVPSESYHVQLVCLFKRMSFGVLITEMKKK